MTGEQARWWTPRGAGQVLNAHLTGLPAGQHVTVYRRSALDGLVEPVEGTTTAVPGLVLTVQRGAAEAWSLTHARSGRPVIGPADPDVLEACLCHPWVRAADWTVSGRDPKEWPEDVRLRVLAVRDAVDWRRALPDPGGRP